MAASLAETARSEGWDYPEFLAKVLSEEVASRETHGGENRVIAARFPQTKTLDDFDFTHQRLSGRMAPESSSHSLSGSGPAHPQRAETPAHARVSAARPEELESPTS